MVSIGTEDESGARIFFKGTPEALAKLERHRRDRNSEHLNFDGLEQGAILVARSARSAVRLIGITLHVDPMQVCAAGAVAAYRTLPVPLLKHGLKQDCRLL